LPHITANMNIAQQQLKETIHNKILGNAITHIFGATKPQEGIIERYLTELPKQLLQAFDQKLLSNILTPVKTALAKNSTVLKERDDKIVKMAQEIGEIQKTIQEEQSKWQQEKKRMQLAHMVQQQALQAALTQSQRRTVDVPRPREDVPKTEQCSDLERMEKKISSTIIQNLSVLLKKNIERDNDVSPDFASLITHLEMLHSMPEKPALKDLENEAIGKIIAYMHKQLERLLGTHISSSITGVEIFESSSKIIMPPFQSHNTSSQFRTITQALRDATSNYRDKNNVFGLINNSAFRNLLLQVNDYITRVMNSTAQHNMLTRLHTLANPDQKKSLAKIEGIYSDILAKLENLAESYNSVATQYFAAVGEIIKKPRVLTEEKVDTLRNRIRNMFNHPLETFFHNRNFATAIPGYGPLLIISVQDIQNALYPLGQLFAHCYRDYLKTYTTAVTLYKKNLRPITKRTPAAADAIQKKLDESSQQYQNFIKQFVYFE
jgi:hypothetical protein